MSKTIKIFLLLFVFLIASTPISNSQDAPDKTRFEILIDSYNELLAKKQDILSAKDIIEKELLKAEGRIQERKWQDNQEAKELAKKEMSIDKVEEDTDEEDEEDTE